MGKILLLLLLAVAGWLLIKGLLKKKGGDAAGTPVSRPERMVKCDLCGVFMPESDSVQLDDKRSCGKPKQCLRRQDL